jgi:hypothetical protein
MFVYRENDPSGTYLIPQTSHAWLAWQIAGHWGNRSFARPSPRAETLAAVLLHDCGWSDYDEAPEIDADGRPRTFDRMAASEHLAIWRTSIARSAQYSRYSGLLVASHFAAMADRKLADLLDHGSNADARLTRSFTAEMERLEDSWLEELSADPRYAPALSGPARETNARLLDTCDRISVYLCASLPSPFEVWAQNAAGNTEVVSFDTVDRTTWRVHPWPLQGERMQIHCEGKRLARVQFESADEFSEALRRATVERLVFTLLRPSAVS